MLYNVKLPLFNNFYISSYLTTLQPNHYIKKYSNYQLMTKAQIAAEISTKTGIEKVVVTTIIESFMKAIKTNMVSGHNIYLRGFGSFILKKRAKKTARIISKNKAIIIPAHTIPSFKPAKVFTDKIKISAKDKAETAKK